MTSAKSKEVADEYISSLSDLTFNSKPLINMLTMLADDNVEHAPAIVQAVENHLQKVRSEIKLPVLYLIDSIVKNVNGSYLSLFTQNIVNTFCGVFEKVDESTRASMWKLRQTWNDVFPPNKLFSLDVRVQSIDPAWPVTASPTGSISSGSIHVNPRFLSMPQTATTIVSTSTVSTVKQTQAATASQTEAAMREQLLKKQKKLLELQKQKIELELLQAKASLYQQLDKQAMNFSKSELNVSTSTETPTTEESVTTLPNQSSKAVLKQSSTGSKNTGSNNGPRIIPASSIAVAAARPVSRDPRLKTCQESTTTVEYRQQRSVVSNQKDSRSDESTKKLLPNINTTVLSDQLKEQLITKQDVTSTINKPLTTNTGSDTTLTPNASNNNISNANISNNNNLNNKSLSSNTNKDAVSHRSNQKKDPRSSSISIGNLNSSKGNQNQSINDDNSTLSATLLASNNNRGSGGVTDSKTKDTKSFTSNIRGASSSSLSCDKSSVSSKSHRKLGNKSRSKQPQSSPSKIARVDRDSSPVRSKSHEKDNHSNDDLSPSSRVSPQSSSSSSFSHASSKNRKKNMKSRKRSPSLPYRIPRRNDTKSNLNLINSGGVTEEEQSGSLIVSPPHPPTFKEIRPNRQRNYMRRNKDGSLSPEHSPVDSGNSIMDPAINKDEDLRTTLALSRGKTTPSTAATPTDTTTNATSMGSGSAAATILEKKEDLDLRILPPVNPSKRQSNEQYESNNQKKSKAEKFDALFGNEDIDLRTLTHPKAGRPPTPPPPVISGEDSKDSWAKLKNPSKNFERDKPTNSIDEKRERDRNRDRLGRLRLYNKLPDDPKERRRTLSSEDDIRPGRRGRENDKPERNEDRNIEIIMKQAAEQLNQGSITKMQYNTLIQQVLHMSEDRKLRAAQRKEKESGSIVWEKGINIDGNVSMDRTCNYNSGDNESLRNKERSRNSSGPRWQNQTWQQPGPWAHPSGPPFASQPSHFGSDFRAVGPWQNQRPFGSMRSDYPYHAPFNCHNIGSNHSRLGHGMMSTITSNTSSNISNLLSNGPPSQSLISGMNGPGGLITNGPSSNISSISSLQSSTSGNLSPNTTSKYDLKDSEQSFDGSQNKNISSSHSRELPLPNPKLLEEISRDSMRSINIYNVPREIRYYGETGVVFMKWDDPREIGFQDGVRRILIGDKDTITCSFNDQYKEFIYEGEVHRIRLGGPTRELYIDDRWYECYFGGMPITVDLNGKSVQIELEGPPPQVKIGTVKRTDLVIAKINLIINARNMVPVFVDSKPQMFEIEGESYTLEFIDALQTVLLNGRPFKVEFGGLPKPIIVRDNIRHFIRFSVLPKKVRPGYVKIKGMRGEEPIEAPPTPPSLNASKTHLDISTSMMSSCPIEPESTSQDEMDLTSSTKPDLQLDILSSVLPSAMAPSSGLSYQAEPVKNPSQIPLPLNMSELFQRLVETGIVPNLPEQKKPENEEGDKKEVEILPVSFNKPETLKIKQPAIATALYSGMQCSSCGARFAPELATRYSHHLDWHFRQNRREKDSARKAHSRPWYYDVSDWIQFEEIEDLEDRAQSWFETEKQSAETEGITTDDSPQETFQPSVPTGGDEDSRCNVCHDAFEQFYNEEKEEWHLRPAINQEGKNFHPLCLEDFKRALEKSVAAVLEEPTGETEEPKKECTCDTTIDNSEVTIVEDVPKEEEIEKIVVDIEDEEAEEAGENIVESVGQTDTKNPDEVENIESDKTIEETNENDDEITKEDNVEENNSEEPGVQATIEPFENIKIKEEPIDQVEDYEEEDFSFVNVPVKQEPEQDPEENIINEPAMVDTTHAAVTSSIDGNFELESAPTTIPAAPSRIKINITKPLPVNKEPEESKEKANVETSDEETLVPLVPASLKPALQGRKLSILPPVEKGQELSGLCSIM